MIVGIDVYHKTVMGKGKNSIFAFVATIDPHFS